MTSASPALPLPATLPAVLPATVPATAADLSAQAHEAGRIGAVRRYDILDTPPDGTFDRLAALASQIFDVPIAIVSIVDTDRIWFKSHLGLDATEISRDPGLCASAILHEETWVVSDAANDPRTLANPLVAGDFGLRFYAGHPLTTSDGFNLGTICVIDREPRTVTAQQQEMLEHLAALVVEQLEVRLNARRLVASAESRLREVEELAYALQRSLLPPEMPTIPYLRVAASYHPASRFEVGGDFYDIFPVDGWSWGLVIGDVCGKGPDAASRTSGARYSIRAAAIQQPSPHKVLEVVNQALVRDSSVSAEAPFVTALFARLLPDPNGTRVLFSSAGHPNPIILRANGTAELLGGTGTLLGVFDVVQLEDHSVRLDEGDTLVFYTDGVTDSGYPDRLETAGLVRLLESCRGLTPAELVSRVREVAQSSQRDDIAVVAIRAEAVAG